MELGTTYFISAPLLDPILFFALTIRVILPITISPIIFTDITLLDLLSVFDLINVDLLAKK